MDYYLSRDLPGAKAGSVFKPCSELCHSYVNEETYSFFKLPTAIVESSPLFCPVDPDPTYYVDHPIDQKLPCFRISGGRLSSAVSAGYSIMDNDGTLVGVFRDASVADVVREALEKLNQRRSGSK